MDSLFISTAANPYHLSVGAVVVREDGKILCHRYGDVEINPISPHPLYLVMRESVEAQESLEQAVARGLMEEFGATATPIRFLGGLITHFPIDSVTVEKVNPYILCELVSIDTSLRNSDPENQSDVCWEDKDFLIQAMRAQQKLMTRTDADESTILERI